MAETYNTLFFGASYGSLLATKMALAGHDSTLVCLPEEAELINESGARLRIGVKGGGDFVEVDSRALPGRIRAAGTDQVDPANFDLIALAMQEPQYRASGVRELLDRAAQSGKPCLSIMNMPPPPYLARLAGVDVAALADCYTDAAVWQNFEPALVTLCSPDPQAFRPPDEKANMLQVRLPTNFKAARFDSDAHTAILRAIASDIEAARFESARGPVELPVKLKVHESVFVPLAKWAMLLAGNYRCIGDDEVRPIKDAVHSDLDASRAVYEWVANVCVELGADTADLVPFEKYATAAISLGSPSSAARALAAQAPNIERVDKLVQRIAAQRGMQFDAVDRIVARVDAWLERNRRAAA